ncbi:MAG: hypothetical protein ONB23_09120 [candidate division KSB1 bacterium]|nr:hypothetical protein [candidate division KSB1 bacterium]
MCRELENHLAECPECRLVFDTVRQTVYLYRLAERPAAMPQEVLERVLKTLALKKDQSGSQSL